MLALGIILILVAVAVLLAATTGGSDQAASFDLGLFQVETNTFGVFLIGAGTVVLLVAGLELTRTGLRRARRRRREHQELTRRSEQLEARETQDTQQRENTPPEST